MSGGKQTAQRSFGRCVLTHIFLLPVCAGVGADTYRWADVFLQSHGVLQKNRQVHLQKTDTDPLLWNRYQGRIQFEKRATPRASGRLEKGGPAEHSLQGYAAFRSRKTHRHTRWGGGDSS